MKRIEALASLVDNDAKVIDIGTDHAYLPIYLYKNNITKNVVGSDISSKVLDFAYNNLSKYGLCDKIKLVLSDGFNNITDNFDIAVISGVGTETIKKILDKQDLPNTLIISSHKNVYDLRIYMQNIGYVIKNEVVVKENNIYYNIIKYIKGISKLDEYSLIVGLSNDLEYRDYLLNKYMSLYEKSKNKKYLDIIKIIERKQD